MANQILVNGEYVSTDNPMPVSAAGNLVVATSMFIRPNDTTQYTIGDAVANSTTAAQVQALVFGGMADALGGSGLITNILVWKANTAVISSASFRLYLFNARMTTAFADNAAFNLAAADMSKLVAVHEILLRTEGANSTSTYSLDDSRRFDYKCDASDTTLFGYLTAAAAYTPTALDQFFVRLTARLDA